MAGIGRKNADALALALAAGLRIADAAAKAGIGERTAYRQLADPAFRHRVQEMRGEMLDQTLGRMTDAMSEAAVVLRELLKADNASVRLSAARSLLDLGLKLREIVDLENRLADLERRYAAEERAS